MPVEPYSGMRMKGPVYVDRIERKYQVGIRADGVASLWRDLNGYLPRYGLEPIHEITSVGSVYFDNADCDLLRYSLLGRLMIVRLRTYETYGSPPEPMSEYWVEVKTANDERRTKKRFRLKKEMLVEFFDGRNADDAVLQYNRAGGAPDVVGNLYREAQEMVLGMGLKPILLVTYKRIAFQNEVERLSIDWDVAYYHVTRSIYDYSTWKYPLESATGRANKIILELKYLSGEVPSWFGELQRKYPIWEKDYLKPVEGMGYLFEGPLKHHKRADAFRPMIDAYMADTQPLR